MSCGTSFRQMSQKLTEISANLQLVITFVFLYFHDDVRVSSKLVHMCLCYNTGKNSEQNEIIIGFRLSSYASGSTAVGPVDDLCHIPENMKTAVKVNFNFRLFANCR